MSCVEVEPESLLRRAVQQCGGDCERFSITSVRHVDERQRRDLTRALSVMTGGGRGPVAHAIVDIASPNGVTRVALCDDEAWNLAVLRTAVDDLTELVSRSS